MTGAMSAPHDNSPWPWAPTLPPAGSPWRRRAPRLRAAGYAVLFVALATVCVQFHARTARRVAKARRVDQAFLKTQAAHAAEPTEANRLAALSAAEAVITVKRRQGAIPRWTVAVRQFWKGVNIYRSMPGQGAGDPLTGERRVGAPQAAPTPPVCLDATPAELIERPVFLHPNMPFVVIALTPVAYLSAQAMVAAVNLLKIAALLAAIMWTAAAVNHRGHRMGEWVIGLAVLLALPNLISDFQHANTNVFVLAAIAAHLALYRRGRDGWAGVALAGAICLKMTPALFAVYWLYQRNWRLLGGLAGSLAAMVVLVPLTVLGWGRYDAMMGAWLGNLIVPGLLKGAPYPIHINQSLSGVFTRLFMHANIHYNPDDVAVAEKFAYINIASLSPAAGRAILVALKAALVAVMAWAIGWRRLARDDGRRGLHYGLIVSAMMIANQRTWDHHAAVLLIAYAALWYALAYGLMPRGRRIGALAALGVAGAIVFVTGKSLFVALGGGGERGKQFAAVVEAWGPTFVHFVIIWVLCVVCLRALRSDGRVYAPDRQTLRAGRHGAERR